MEKVREQVIEVERVSSDSQNSESSKTVTITEGCKEQNYVNKEAESSGSTVADSKSLADKEDLLLLNSSILLPRCKFWVSLYTVI